MKILEMGNIRVQLSSIISGVIFDDFIITWKSGPCTLNGLVSKEEATFVWYNNSSITFHCFHMNVGQAYSTKSKDYIHLQPLSEIDLAF